MSARPRKSPTMGRSTPGIRITSVEPGNFFDFREGKPRNVKVKSSNGTSTPMKPGEYDRRFLKDIEFFLGRCVNLAEHVEDKRAAKIARLLRDARERAIRLRDALRPT